MNGRRIILTIPASWRVLSDLTDEQSVGGGTRLRTPDGFTATVVSLGPAVKAAGFEQYVQIAIDVGGQVVLPAVSTLIANWVWDHFHDKARGVAVAPPSPEREELDALVPFARLTIDEPMIEFDDEGRAKRMIAERITVTATRPSEDERDD